MTRLLGGALAIVGFALVGLAPRCSHAATAEVWAEEISYAALRTVDTLQSAGMCDNPKFREGSNLLDGGGWLIGSRPTRQAQYLYGAGDVALHGAVTAALVYWHASPWAVRGWEAVTIGLEGYTVRHNARIGASVHF